MPAPLSVSWVNLGVLLHLSEAQGSHLQNGHSNSYVVELQGSINEK